MNRSFRAVLLAACLFAPPAFADYTLNQDGTATDNATGLVWDRCPLGWAWDADNTTCVDDPAMPDAYTWAEALTAAVSRNNGNHRGHADWRLPNRKELDSLVDLTKASGTMIDETAFPNTPSNAFWSSTTYALGVGMAWIVSFNDGHSYGYGKTFGFPVRLVRGGQSFDLLAVDGVCGNAHGAPTLSAPAGPALCAAGTAGSVSDGPASFTWNCAGENGGNPASCSAPRQYEVTPSAGASGTISPDTVQAVSHGLSTSFTVTPLPGHSASIGGSCPAGSWTGSVYTTGPITSACSVVANFSSLPVSGACGAADGIAALLAPAAAALCSTGTASAVSSVNGEHAWNCVGSHGGTTAQCSAPGQASAGSEAGRVVASIVGTGCTVESATLVSPLAGGPAAVSLPYGALSFVLSGCSGGSATVTASFSGSLDDMVWWKYIDGAWQPMPATLSDNTASFTVVDDGPYDADKTPGRIVDPGGPGLAAAAPGALPVPGLSRWAALLLMLLTASLGLGWLQRRQG